jgi:regulatory protein
MPLNKPKQLDAAGLRDYAHRLLAGRPLSVDELRAKLRRRASNAADIEPIVAMLKEYGAVDDSKLAESFAASRRDSLGVGKQRVLADLTRRRVSGGIARRAVEDAYKDTDESAMITQWLERKYRHQDLGTLLKDPAKLASVYRRLRVAGFATGPAIKVLKRFAAAADELENLEDV